MTHEYHHGVVGFSLRPLSAQSHAPAAAAAIVTLAHVPITQPAQKTTQVQSPILRGPPKTPYIDIRILVYARCGFVGMPID